MSSQAIPSILKKIIEDKSLWVEARKDQISLVDIKSLASDTQPAKAFSQAIRETISAGRIAVIAEIKKASPSQGVIRADFNPQQIAQSYQAHGAACLSVLTDAPYFQGDDQYLKQVRQAVSLPLLRKDFMIDPYQIYEARVLGADCVLLIAAVLSADQMAEMAHIAQSLGMSVLVEVHDIQELSKLASLPQGYMLGVNNRDLHTFKVSLDTTRLVKEAWGLAQKQQPGSVSADRAVFVSESGIHTQEDIATLKAMNVHCFLIGESLMKAPDPGLALKKLLGE